MCYGKATEMKCPNPLCDERFERVDYAIDPPPIPVTPTPSWAPVGSGDEPCVECPVCGIDLEEALQVVALYRQRREAFVAAADKADDAFGRWFAKGHAGVATNGAQANRLSHEANYLSADLSGVEGKLYAMDVDPRDVDKLDGTDALKDRVV